MSVLIKFVYPATLTALGIIGNAYILGNQIKALRDDLTVGIKEMELDLKEVKGDLKELKHDVKGLTAHQTELKLHHMFIAERILKDCGKSK